MTRLLEHGGEILFSAFALFVLAVYVLALAGLPWALHFVGAK